MKEWTNWSGSLHFRPAQIVPPDTDQAIVQLVRRASTQHRTIRVVGAGHSSSPLVETPDILVSLERLKGSTTYDHARSEATLSAGMSLHQASRVLQENGFSLE